MRETFAKDLDLIVQSVKSVDQKHCPRLRRSSITKVREHSNQSLDI